MNNLSFSTFCNLTVPMGFGFWGKVKNFILGFPGMERFVNIHWWLEFLFRSCKNDCLQYLNKSTIGCENCNYGLKKAEKWLGILSRLKIGNLGLLRTSQKVRGLHH